MILQQISVFVENRPGALEELTQLLAEAQIDLRALNIAESSDYGVLRLITSHPHKTAAVLQQHQIPVTLTPITVVAVPDRPGGLGELLQLLSSEGINILYMYSAFSHRNGTAHMAFRVDDPEALETLLAKHHMPAALPEDLGIEKE